ncbi:outer membrane beta-barrel protein [Thermoflexibacter ruber]|uniref:Putative beta-barrel porin-2, OmpL-like. bbp2 n=1 Tax=Thermoflexibacter ruber TaxID=1003 RepID=A0A1I2F6F7_9BACT|nr:outer membrane beta-barrel protein [Thermoflexibacter ruber]SFF00427.1 Putative beta-barrel porin-2, OmpL-like. bbp2 [Thermoflexibacter ruber]
MKKSSFSILYTSFLIGVLSCAYTVSAQQKGEPFEGIDQTWQNGSDRRDSSVFKNMKYFTPSILMDINYNYSFNNPIDNTVVGSTALARHNELQLSALHFGGDLSYGNARARVMTQFGTRSTVVPRNDFSPYRGQYNLANVYRYLSEAYAGYHINKWNGINIDFGMFMSYIGLNSYYQPENWEYQASFTSDNTPWFFVGSRIQIHPNKNWKIEPWIINGWQSYGKFNKMPGLGGNITYMSSNGNWKVLTNDYFGTDAAGIPDRVRFHSDNSVLHRYLNQPQSKGISRMAFSLTGDIGFEKGGGVNGFDNSPNKPAQYFLSVMFYNRTWFAKNKLAWTIGGGWMKNPGRYLVLYPTGQASPLPNPQDPTKREGMFPFSANPGDQFEGWDMSTNIDWMPNQSLTFRLEYINRNASVGYFAGGGGVTSSTGLTTTPVDPNGTWRPDLVKNESKVIFALLFRL